MLGKFLDPKNDVAFKKIFGTEKNKHILIHFLNDMISFQKKEKIEDVVFLKTAQDPETAAHKSSIVDILCKDSKGRSYIVEMQVAKEKGFEKRAQYYASKAYNSQLMKSGEYHTLMEIIFLAICDHNVFPKKKQYKSDHVILDRETYERDLKDFSFTFLELPKFKKDIDHLTNIVEKWLYFFKHAEETKEEDLKKIIDHDEVIGAAFMELDRFSWGEEELLQYDQAEKYMGAYLASLEQKYDEGRAEGQAEGEKIGIEKERLSMVKNMSEKGLDVETISSFTGLSPSKIQSLLDKSRM